MTTWPASLPGPHPDYQITPAGGLSDDEETCNPQRTRTYPEQELKARFFMTADEFATFRAWWRGGLHQGAALFTAGWLETLGFAFHRARFIGPWTAKREGLCWTLETKLEIIAGVPVDGEGRPAIWPPEGG